MDTPRRTAPVTKNHQEVVAENAAKVSSVIDTGQSVEELRDSATLNAGASEDAVQLDYADALAFAEQELMIVIAPPTDRTNKESYVVQLGCNGRMQQVIRGQPSKVKRKYVEVAMRAKEIEIQTNEFTTNDGGRAVRIDRNVNQKLLVSVIHDPAGIKGQQWLMGLMQDL